MQKQACFDGQVQSEPINNHEALENLEQTCVPNMSCKNQVINFIITVLYEHITKALQTNNFFMKFFKKSATKHVENNNSSEKYHKINIMQACPM